ncbi:hypothetical protein EVAR_34074_1 [Eumeta japonica]|uniref:Uncharacterized protein n=1 Tax=Eumeta variegata TaxID=151549 RepID=A0A4C1WLV5_EUMVA|nr:hypothetical protein EVAR_34074_1 [Eumeta japonica]
MTRTHTGDKPQMPRPQYLAKERAERRGEKRGERTERVGTQDHSHSKIQGPHPSAGSLRDVDARQSFKYVRSDTPQLMSVSDICVFVVVWGVLRNKKKTTG